MNDKYYKIGLNYMSEKEFEKAEKAFNTSLENGNFHSFHELANIYINHKKDGKKAVIYLQRSILKKFRWQEAYYKLGCIFYLGLGNIEVNYKQAFDRFTRGKNSDCLFMAGKMSLTGKGTTKNEKAAFKFFKESADNGNLKSMKMVSEMYRNGIGVEKNNSKSRMWRKKRKRKMKEDPTANKEPILFESEEPTEPEENINVKTGAIVWIRVEGHPWWPALVVDERDYEEYDNIVENQYENEYLGKFFNDDKFWWFKKSDFNHSVKFFIHNDPFIDADVLDEQYDNDVLKKAILEAKYFAMRKVEMEQNQKVRKISAKKLTSMAKVQKIRIPKRNDVLRIPKKRSGVKIKKRKKSDLDDDLIIVNKDNNELPTIDWKPLKKKARDVDDVYLCYEIIKPGYVLKEPFFHDVRNIYPLGFISAAVLKTQCFILEILKDDDKQDPIFSLKRVKQNEIISTFKSTSLRKAFHYVSELPAPPELRKFFGLEDKKLISLPNALDYCKKNVKVLQQKRLNEEAEEKRRIETEKRRQEIQLRIKERKKIIDEQKRKAREQRRREDLERKRKDQEERRIKEERERKQYEIERKRREIERKKKEKERRERIEKQRRIEKELIEKRRKEKEEQDKLRRKLAELEKEKKEREREKEREKKSLKSFRQRKKYLDDDSDEDSDVNEEKESDLDEKKESKRDIDNKRRDKRRDDDKRDKEGRDERRSEGRDKRRGRGRDESREEGRDEGRGRRRKSDDYKYGRRGGRDDDDRRSERREKRRDDRREDRDKRRDDRIDKRNDERRNEGSRNEGRDIRRERSRDEGRERSRDEGRERKRDEGRERKRDRSREMRENDFRGERRGRGMRGTAFRGRGRGRGGRNDFMSGSRGRGRGGRGGIGYNKERSFRGRGRGFRGNNVRGRAFGVFRENTRIEPPRFPETTIVSQQIPQQVTTQQIVPQQVPQIVPQQIHPQQIVPQQVTQQQVVNQVQPVDFSKYNNVNVGNIGLISTIRHVPIVQREQLVPRREDMVVTRHEEMVVPRREEMVVPRHEEIVVRHEEMVVPRREEFVERGNMRVGGMIGRGGRRGGGNFHGRIIQINPMVVHTKRKYNEITNLNNEVPEYKGVPKRRKIDRPPFQ